jgi:hypothetical protein
MIEVSTFDTIGKEYVSNCYSIIDDVTISEIDIGYEVFINLKTRAYEVSHFGSSSGADAPETSSICFEDEKELYHTVEWEVPQQYSKGVCRLMNVSKDQVTLYFIAYKYLGGEIKIAEYECPTKKLKETVDRFTT